MKKLIKRIALGLGVIVLLLGAGGGIFACTQASAFDESMNKVYDVPAPNVTRSTDPAVIARGKHLVESIAGCASKDCHGADLGGGSTLVMGPLGTFSGPNISGSSITVAYSDGELVRLVKHGLRKDGRSVRFMPAQDISWLPDEDALAIVSYLRTVPPVDRANGTTQVGLLGKILDRQGAIVLDVGRKIDHAKVEKVPAPEPTAAYGQFVARLCTGCHGEKLSGGKIPGTPSDFAIPANLTPHETGLKGWTYEDFDKLLTAGIRKDGKPLDKLMPIEATAKADEIEKKALWVYLQSLPPTPFGNR